MNLNAEQQYKTEHKLQQLILAQVSLIEGVFLWRSNAGAARAATGRMVRFGMPGQADLSGVLRGGFRLEIEVKSATRKLTPEQKAFGNRVLELGGLYWVARSLDDALRPIRKILTERVPSADSMRALFMMLQAER